MLWWGNVAYCIKLSGEDTSRSSVFFSNKINQLFKKMSLKHTKKTIYHNNKHFSELAPHNEGLT